jgi:hypothetical protein
LVVVVVVVVAVAVAVAVVCVCVCVCAGGWAGWDRDGKPTGSHEHALIHTHSAHKVPACALRCTIRSRMRDLSDLFYVQPIGDRVERMSAWQFVRVCACVSVSVCVCVCVCGCVCVCVCA